MEAHYLEAYEELERRRVRQRALKDKRSRQVRHELRKDPHRGCLIGNTFSPGTDIRSFLDRLNGRQRVLGEVAFG